MKNAKELAGEIYDKYGNGDNSSVELIERDREEVRDEERRACAERFRARIEAWQPTAAFAREIKATLLTDGVAVILSPEPVEPSELKE